MDREEHGEDSSSRNGNPVVILEILQRGTEDVRRRVRLSDGSSFFCSTALVREFGLAEGMLLEGETGTLFREALEVELAEAKAVELLARRDHSREELRRKLRKRSFSSAAIRTVLDRLEARGYLDSTKFAREWIRSRLSRHPEGRKFLYAGLTAHGLSREEAERAVTEVDDEVLLEAALRAAEKFLRRPGIAQLEMTKRLFSLGFDKRLVMQVVDRLK